LPALLDQAVDLRFGVGGGAGNAQEILRGGGAEHRVDIDAFLEMFLADAAEIDFLLITTGTMAVWLVPSTLNPQALTAATDSAGRRAEKTNGRAVYFSRAAHSAGHIDTFTYL
jgi:hypothetical protein